MQSLPQANGTDSSFFNLRLCAAEQAVADASPRGQTVDGGIPGAAGAFLGAVKKDAVTADHVAEAGPLSVADQGVCCIEHLEKLTAHHAVRFACCCFIAGPNKHRLPVHLHALT